MGAPPSYLGDAEAVIELARYREAPIPAAPPDVLLSWPVGVEFAGYRARDVADILRAGGADVR